MNIKKYILSIGLALGLVLPSFADVVVLTIPGAAQALTTNLVYQGPVRLLNFTVTAGSNFFFRIFDSPYVTNTINIGAFTNFVRVVATTNVTYTTPFGVPVTNSYTVIRTITNYVGAVSQSRESVYAGNAISNTVAFVDFGAGKFFGGGILVTNIPHASLIPSTIVFEYEKLEP